MNKSELVKSIAAKANITAKQADAAVDAFIESIGDAFKLDEKVQLVGFGTFELKKKAAREGINPATKEKIKIKASYSPSFKAGKAFKDLFNK